MSVTIAIPTYRRFELAAACVASALAGTLRPDQVLVIDNSGGACPQIAGADIVLGRQPQSVARAWNDAVRSVGGDWLILANDDVQLAPDTIARLVEAAEREPEAGIVSAAEGERFCCFLLRWCCYQEVGPFDEQFAPAYFEDNDYARRLTLAGWMLGVAPSAVRHGGSQTIASYAGAEAEAHHHAFRLNAARFVAKWGGPPHRETFDTPYGVR